MSSRNGVMYDAVSTETDQLNEGARSDADSNLKPLNPLKGVDCNENESQDEHVEYVEIIILDSAQNRFPVDVSPGWTVKRLKEVSQQIHKVNPQSQRLIFRGRMLEDDATLEAVGIEENGVIVHLVCQIDDFSVRFVLIITQNLVANQLFCDNSAWLLHLILIF